MSNGSSVAPQGAVYSVNETLARGLVKRLASECRATERLFAERAGAPLLGTKRAANFRALAKWIQGAMVPKLVVGHFYVGDPSGKDKNAQMALYHWSTTGDDESRLDLCRVCLDARKLDFDRQLLLQVSRHAIERLYQRLKTMDENVVLIELAHLAACFVRWDFAIVRCGIPTQLMLPTPHGVFVVVRDSEKPMMFAAKTFMGFDQIPVDAPRRKAAELAMRGKGFALNVAPAYPVFTMKTMGLKEDAGLYTLSHDKLNAFADAQFDSRSRLPAEHRFMSLADVAQHCLEKKQIQLVRQAWEETMYESEAAAIEAGFDIDEVQKHTAELRQAAQRLGL